MEGCRPVNAFGLTLVGMTDVLDFVATPNCPRCLLPMVLEDDPARWRCDECRVIRL